jgi:hypothetical protein
MTRASEALGRARQPRNIPPPASLTVAEASAALGTLLAGRSTIPPRDELRAMVAAKAAKPTLSPATVRLVRAVETAAVTARRSADPVARALAETVVVVVGLAKAGVRHG